MNEHLARFFEQADLLLEEWKAYGETLRASLDAQARELETTIAQAVENAGRQASGALSEHMEESLRASLERLRQEVDVMSQRLRVAGQAGGRSRADTNDPSRAVAVHHEAPAKARPWQSGVVLLGLTLANVILAVLLIASIRSCRGEVYENRPGSGWDQPEDAPMGARDTGTAGPTDAGTPGPADAAAPEPADAGQKTPSGDGEAAPGPDKGDGKTGGKGEGSKASDKSGKSGKTGSKATKDGKKRERKGTSP